MNYMTFPGLSPKLNPREQIIINRVLDFYKTTMSSITKKGRNVEKVRPRQMIMYLLRKKTSMTWGQIADVFDKDHVTAMYSFKAITQSIETNDNDGKVALQLLSEL